MQTPHAEFIMFDSVSHIICALQNIIARSQVIIPVLETPYSKFPNTDRSTIELERQSVVNIIAQRQQQLDTIQHEISGLEAVMDNVENLRQAVLEKREKVTQSMNLHKGLLSAHWRFPTEILSQIFKHCLPDYIYFLSPSSLPVQAPILLTRICRRWREVAVGTPGLWCRLYVQADDKKLLKAPFCYDLWLKRSRGCPLSLEIGYHYSTRLPSLLRPYMSHITSLQVYGDYFGGRHPRLLATDLLALQELAIRGTSNDDVPTIAQSITQLPSTMRSLKFIDMTPFFDIEPLSSFSPIWANLTNVQIAVCHPNAFLHLLQLCPNLSSLNTQIEMDQGGPLKSFTHTKLQSLCILYYASLVRTLSELLNALSLPNLHALEARYNTSWPHEDIKAFLARSKCPLETLTISSGMTITDAQQAEYVSLTPSFKGVNYNNSSYSW